MHIKMQAILNYPEQTRSPGAFNTHNLEMIPELRRFSLGLLPKMWIENNLKLNAAPNINVEILILMEKKCSYFPFGIT